MFRRVLLAIVAVCLMTSCSLHEFIPPTTSTGYLNLALLYKQRGWTEKARTSLHKAIDIDPESAAGRAAAIYLRARIPKYGVSEEAETANINAYNLMVAGQDEAAIIAFKDVIQKYPKFEWPYVNLASIYIKAGNFEEGKALLQKVLAINPYYYNAWDLLADAYQGLNDEAGVKRCQQKTSEIIPKAYLDAGY